MNNYQRINPATPKNIETRKAYLIGGGIGSLSAAAFLIRDGHMPGRNIHVIEQLDVFGGSMDGAGMPEKGYTARGGREIEEHFECFMELYSFIPSLNDKNKSVLDEFRQLNIEEPIESHCRLVQNQGEKADFSSLGLSKSNAMELAKLHMLTEEALGATTIGEYFEPSFFETNFWYFWATMFAFEKWHSVVEVKRYMERFMHLIGGMNRLKGILHTEYNQYDSLILPLITWLKEQDVCFETGCKVTDIDFDFSNNEKVATAIHYIKNDKNEIINVKSDDIVLFINGSMTENTTKGDLDHAAILNRSEDKGCFSVWEKITKKSSDFGHPEKFCSDIDKTKWMSFTITLKDDDIVFPYIQNLTGDKPGMGGLVTIKDSSWFMSWVVPKHPHFIGQPDNVKVLWAYALNMDIPGDYIKKTFSNCTGREMFEELLYHMGLQDRIPEILSHTVNVIPSMMPYITSQFMPRVAGDRPNVIPAGSKNFGFLGQYTEIPEDCVFTVEYSVRSAMMAVYGLLGLEKQVDPVYPSQYDIRVLINASKTCLGIDKLPLKNISLGELLKYSELGKLL
ncbi:oleate hydratase [Clostridium botulinum]|uniref:Myosin-cross-reactive antigen family protein n=1 Tax=Clostridium botulinum (strain Langeland / NCTC 10281 / Type F) TaxID=441772 RepID=A7GBA7_CLOBL|nr:oleate hydratase [Clostridium botulinum]ABS39566.1 myosin-cross-reactive antigen family protein [Clostridium botulinum F str. Langeland]ADF98534.1 myosin-cross-reactive antigen family protein [Clostridium botulinum F str. 230613]KKM40179.1 oleate hydratase [Clostridium botulinum]MBY6791804.1 oleate hydratase [Clostridium botulinum]MBY6935811.1 oleate hydratase [Clostridium botulinum]